MADTILLVEDDPAILRGLEMNLRVDGYQVVTALDGAAAVRSFEAARPDLVILDLGLPSMDGFDVVQAMRRSDAETPILVLSARHGESDKVLALSFGADDYVTKPFGLAELLVRLRVLLRRRRRTASVVVLRFGRCEVDPTARVLRVDGVEVEVTALEFELLMFLVSRPRRAVTREQIIQSVWGAGHAGTPRTVDNFVARLRTKIEPDPAAPVHIETVRGVGYRFDPG